MRKYTDRELDQMIMIKPWEARIIIEERQLKEAVKRALIESGHTEEEAAELISNGNLLTEIVDEKGKSIFTFH